MWLYNIEIFLRLRTLKKQNFSSVWNHTPSLLCSYSECLWCLQTACCQSPILSDQVLVDLPCMEGIVFSIRFTYLKIVDVIRNF